MSGESDTVRGGTGRGGRVVEARPSLTGLILAGGRSSRMGRDKALLAWGGEPLVDRVSRRITPACAALLVASGDGHRLGRPGEIADAMPGVGPLGGLLAGLEAAATPLIAAIAVDQPYADPHVLTILARLLEATPTAAAAVPFVGGRPQPLHAVYRRAAAPRLRTLLEAGERSVTAAVQLLGVTEAGPDVWGGADPDGRFAVNLNHPEDLAGAGGEVPGPVAGP